MATQIKHIFIEQSSYQSIINNRCILRGVKPQNAFDNSKNASISAGLKFLLDVSNIYLRGGDKQNCHTQRLVIIKSFGDEWKFSKR